MSTRDRDGEFGKGHSGSAWEQDTTHATDYPLGPPRPFYLPPKAMEARLRGSVENMELHLARGRTGRIVDEALQGQTPAEPTQAQAFAQSLVEQIPSDKRALLPQLTAIRQKSAMMRRPSEQALLSENENWFNPYQQGFDQLLALEQLAVQNQIAPKGKPVLLAIEGDKLPIGMNETAKAAPTLTPYAPVATAGTAFHDGSKAAPLGRGDSAFNEYGTVIQAFPATADGVVAAALYELHRGDKRGLAEILADDSAGRTARGPDAAIEKRVGGKPMNDDAANAPIIGHLPKLSDKDKIQGDVAAIRAYFYAADIHNVPKADKVAPPWCGSFATFVYRRAGIDVLPLAYSMKVAKSLSKSGTRENPGSYFHITGSEETKGHKKNYQGRLRHGAHDETTLEGTECYDSDVKNLSGITIDIRPGDVLWQEHDANHGHVGIVLGVHKTETEITIVSAEGNADQKLQRRVHTITIKDKEHVTATFKGWGRPAELNQATAPAQSAEEPSWIHAAVQGGDHVKNDR